MAVKTKVSNLQNKNRLGIHFNENTSYSKLSEVKLITIGLASPERIKQWAEKTLPNGKILGEVINANTLHHKTFKPQKGGLFCERIFGPLKDFECACGKPLKYKKQSAPLEESKLEKQNVSLNENSMKPVELSLNNSILGQIGTKTRNFCNICEVEYTWSVMRRYQLGYIKLISPVTHVWYLKGNPSYLSILLDIKKRHLEYITYCSETLTLENALKGNIASSKSSDIISSWNKLKEEIISAKEKKNQIENKQNRDAHFSVADNKIQKREKLILKKHYYWKLFYNENLTKTGVQTLKKATKNDNFNDWYNLLSSREIQFKQIELSKNNTSGKPPESTWHNLSNTMMYYLKGYAKNPRWGLSELKFLSFIITQEKEAKLKNNFYAKDIGWQRGTAKQIFKNISIPFYILLNLNVFSQKSISKHVVNTAWRFTLKKALKLAFIRVNHIFNKIQTSSFQQNSIFFFLASLNEVEKIAFSSSFATKKKAIKNLNLLEKQMGELDKQTIIEELSGELDNKTINSYYFFLKKAKLDFYRENNQQDKTLVNSFRESIKLLKNYFYNLVDEHSQIKTNFESIPLGKNALNKKGHKLAPQLKSHFYLEFYTLSNVPTSLANFIISVFYYSFKPSFGSIKRIDEEVNLLNNSVRPKHDKTKAYTELDFEMEGSKATYPIILKNLSEIFFKNLIQNAVPALKSLAYENYKIKKQMLLNKNKLKQLSNLNLPIDNYTRADKIKKNSLKDFKKSLSIFYFVANSNKFKNIKKQISKDGTFSPIRLSFANLGSLELDTLIREKTDNNAIKEIFLDSASNDGTLLKNNLATKKEFAKQDKNYFNFVQKVTSIEQEGKTSKKLYNNIYTLSHRERWEVENDWNFLYYFMTGASENLATPLIPNYRERYSPKETEFVSQNQYRSNFAELDYNASLAFQGSGYFNLQKSAFFSGPGIVQQLLNEFNFYEIKKMDKQNRILLYQLNKQIFKLKKYASPTPFVNTTPIISRIPTDSWGNSKSRPNTNSNFATTSFSKSGVFGSGSVRADSRNLISKRDRTSKKELKEAYKKRDLLIRRTKLVRKLFIKESSPQATILTILPVLPPDLRPIVKMGGQIAASDLNRLYQRVIYRNDRLKKFLKDPATSHSYEMKYAQRLLQEAVDNLIQNGKSGVVSEKDSRGRALKSLSDILKGKQGRFRQYLLGKRVDYSGRSVIVVGPKLKLHECGIPKEMAIELYLPFLLKRILNENLARTVVGAKTLIKTNPSLIWELLREIMQTCPVLLNRAPTLHRLGIQAFQPKLIDGRAILLHPLVCSAFNADFDGDQMAVHVPITVEARAEAWKLMLSRNNILSPATGEPLAIPSQDMVLGCYYLTTNLLNSKTPNFAHKKGSGFYFSNIEDALKAYHLNEIDLHANIWLKWDTFFENGSDQEEPIEIRIDSYGNRKEIYNKSQKSYYSNNNRYAQYILTTPGKILFNQTLHNFIY